MIKEMKTIKEIFETLNEAPKRGAWLPPHPRPVGARPDVGATQYTKMQTQFKRLGKRLNDKVKDIDKRWPKMTDSEKSGTVVKMVGMRSKLMDTLNTSV